jgi:photosystem II stability/assembly factor-like uncharacterized protein
MIPPISGQSRSPGGTALVERGGMKASWFRHPNGVVASRLDWQLWLDRRGLWIALSLLCVVVAVLMASCSTPANPWVPKAGIAAPSFWLTPAEHNGFRRAIRGYPLINATTLSRNGETALAVGDDGIILRSEDGGTTWTHMVSGTTDDLYSVVLSLDGKIALAGGRNGIILRSADGGLDWSLVSAPDEAGPNLLFIVLSPNGKTALAAAPDSPALRMKWSTDGGVSWTAVESESSWKGLGWFSTLTSIALFPDEKTALAVGSDGTIFRSTDKGLTWAAMTSGTTERLESIAWFPDGATILVGGGDGAILRSEDGGTTWKQMASVTTEGLSSLAPAPDGTTVLAFGEGGTVLRSANRGTDWTVVASGRTHGIQLALGAKAVSMAACQRCTRLRSNTPSGGVPAPSAACR